MLYEHVFVVTVFLVAVFGDTSALERYAGVSYFKLVDASAAITRT